jgi:hypothetical protein
MRAAPKRNSGVELKLKEASWLSRALSMALHRRSVMSEPSLRAPMAQATVTSCLRGGRGGGKGCRRQMKREGQGVYEV